MSVDMTCPPNEGKSNRTVLNTIPVAVSGDWWTGLVRDRDDKTEEERLRMERWVANKHGYSNPHTWRVRPDYWSAELNAVTQLERRKGQSPPGNLPLDSRLTPLEYVLVRRDETRWVAVVRLDRPYKGECLRLYHWNPADGSVRQKWTVGRDWSQLTDLATRHLKNRV